MSAGSIASVRQPDSAAKVPDDLNEKEGKAAMLKKRLTDRMRGGYVCVSLHL